MLFQRRTNRNQPLMADEVSPATEPLSDWGFAVHDLSTWYGRRRVLHDISFSVGPADCVTIVGPNGAGKTTLARTLVGLGEKVRGRVVLNGKDLLRCRANQVVRSGVALVPERGGIFARMTVEENLRMAEDFGGATASAARAAREACYELFPILHERLRQGAGTLSGGERRMLLVSRAMIGSPKVIIMDEPSLGLSPLMAANVVTRLVPELRQRGVAVILIEQKVGLAFAVANQALVLADGHIVAAGTPDEVAQSTTMRRAYVGSRTTSPTKASA
jgi:branched-chain amino acid transport system ATP-binding protein